MPIIINNGHGDHRRLRQMNNIKGLLILAVVLFVAGIVMSIITGIPGLGASICTTAVILAALGFILLWKYKYNSSVTVFSMGGGQTSTTVTSSSMMTHSYQQQQTVRSSTRSHSIVNMRQSSSTNVQRSSSMARIHDQGVLGWGDTRPSAQPVDNGWMANVSQTLDGFRQHQPPHAAQPRMTSQPGGYTQPGGYIQRSGMPPSTQPSSVPQPGGYTQQPGGYTQPGGFTSPAGHPSSSSAGGFTSPAGPRSSGLDPGLAPGPGPSLYSDAPPSYDDAVRLPGKP